MVFNQDIPTGAFVYVSRITNVFSTLPFSVIPSDAQDDKEKMEERVGLIGRIAEAGTYQYKPAHGVNVEFYDGECMWFDPEDLSLIDTNHPAIAIGTEVEILPANLANYNVADIARISIDRISVDFLLRLVEILKGVSGLVTTIAGQIDAHGKVTVHIPGGNEIRIDARELVSNWRGVQ